MTTNTMGRDEAVRQAVARGWYSPENSHKEMDTTLADAIARKVIAALQAQGVGMAEEESQRQLRALALAAVPKKQVPATYHSNERRKAAAYNACRAETIANINALFDKENGNG